MRDEDKTKEQLIRELGELRQQAGSKANELLKREIKKRKMIEEALWESQSRYETLLKALPVGLYQTDPKGRCLYTNELTGELLGLSSEDISGYNWMKAIHPDDRKQVISELKKHTERQIVFRMKHRLTRSDGKVVWVLGQTAPYLGHDNKLLGYVGTLSDITELKAVEDELKKSEERYRSLVELSPDAIAVHSEGKIVFINSLGAKLYGVASPDDLIGKPMLGFIHPDYRDIIKERVRIMLEEGKKVPLLEEKFILPDGTYMDVEVAAAPLTYREKPAVLFVARDITERKRMEEEFKESEERYRCIVETANEGIWIVDAQDKIEFVNEILARMLGFTEKEMIGRSVFQFLHKEDHSVIRAELDRRRRGIREQYDLRLRLKNGKELFCIVSGSPILDNAGQYKGAVAMFTDITLRKRAESELRCSERFLQSIFDSIHDCLSVIDDEFNIVRVNSKAEQLFSAALPLEGKKCYEVYHGEDEICKGCPSIEAFKSDESSNAVMPIKGRNGEIIGWEEHFSYPYIDQTTGELKGVIVYSRNITEKLKMEQEIARLDRFHLIGQMAAGIGHEIRNPMTAVRGFLQLLAIKQEYAKHKNYFNLMLSELDRANSIITEYLSLAKNKPLDMLENNLNTILEVLRPLISANAMNAGINVIIEQYDVPNILLNENEIRQLILNLVKNGLEAMDSAGNLTIRTSMHNGEIVLSVKDQGPGIRPELINKIGTPFFTTKERGTGLGLAVCYGIAARHNAAITIDTGPMGTIFHVRFKL